MPNIPLLLSSPHTELGKNFKYTVYMHTHWIFFFSYISSSHNIIGLAGLKIWVIITYTSISSPTFFYILIACKYGKFKNDAIYTFCSVTLFVCTHVHSVSKLCQTLCDPMDCSLPGSSVHGILGKNTEWVAISFSRICHILDSTYNRYMIFVLTYFNLVWWCLVPSMLLQMASYYSFLWMSSISLYVFTI